MATIQSIVMTPQQYELWINKPDYAIDGCTMEGFSTNTVFYTEKKTTVQGKHVIIISGLYYDSEEELSGNKNNQKEVQQKTPFKEYLKEKGYIKPSKPKLKDIINELDNSNINNYAYRELNISFNIEQVSNDLFVNTDNGILFTNENLAKLMNSTDRGYCITMLDGTKVVKEYQGSNFIVK